MATSISADLDFALEREGRPTVHGHVSGVAGRLVLEVDTPEAFAGAADAPTVRSIAETLAELHVRIRVVSDGRHLITIGDVRAPWWQRGLTGSRRIRMGSLRGALTAARARSTAGDQVLPDLSVLPPLTAWPPAPTMLRRKRRHVGTTHDPGRGGEARLYLAQGSLPGVGAPRVFWLSPGDRIGSGADCEIRLPGLAEVHAVLRHDDNDEWAVETVGGTTRVHGRPVMRENLRTGTAVTVGEHRLSFFREEFADHGRPYGGRIGGELGRQRAQEPRARQDSHSDPDPAPDPGPGDRA